jgi:ABC-type protease/lipase transport system fused ATPase/permease subunit
VPTVKANDADGDQPAPRRPHAILRYTTLRLALFVLALVVLWLVRIRDGVLIVAIALVLSGLASFVLLAGQRDAMSAQLHEAAQRRRVKAQLRAAREDVPDAADIDEAVGEDADEDADEAADV